MKDPCPSNFNTFCQVQTLATKPDGAGGQEAIVEGQLWTNYFTFWAELDWSGGGESQNMDRTQSKDTANLVTYFDARLTPAMRIVLEDGTILNVRDANNRKQRNMWLDIKATAGDGT